MWSNRSVGLYVSRAKDTLYNSDIILRLLPNSSIENVDTRIDRSVKALVELKWFSVLKW